MQEGINARLTSSLERKASEWMDVGRKREKGVGAVLPPAPLIILDLLEMLMSCWVIAHVRPGSRDGGLSRPRSLK